MSRGFYVPCAPFLYFVPDSGGPPQQAQAPPLQGQATSAMDVQLQRPPNSGPTTSATAAAPFQYFLHEQARSLVALQELQHEVGALLEFRELVMDTFPNLRSKLHTTPACTSPAQAPPAGWGPGVRVRRKLGKERVDLAADDSSAESSSKPAGKQHQPKSSEGASSTSGSTVQDSGFSTETKEHLSSVLSPKLAPTCAPPPAAPPSESMDELWNLLDVIQRKGSRLRDEVEELHTKLQRDTQERQQQQQCRRLRVRGGGGEARADVAPDEWLAEAARATAQPDDDWTPDVRSWGDEDESSPRHAANHVMEVQRLRHERDVLLDKVTEMEAETLQSRARVSQLQLELRQVAGVRRELEAQLSAAVLSRLQQQARSEPPTPVRHVISQVGRASCFQPVARSASSPSPRRALHLPADHTRNRESRIPRPHQQPMQPLGRLDGVLSDPSLVRRSLAGLRPDSHKIAAILKENDPLELRRHLLISVVENQALQAQLQTASSSKEDLAGELERVREENDDLRFQLEEKSIELEGTRARVRVLEKHQQRLKCEPVKVAEEALLNSSSTESAHDGSSPVRSIQQPPEPPKRHHSRSTTIKGKKPSRIPLPPPKAFSAPSSKAPAQHARVPPGRKNDSPASSLQNTRLSRESISSRSNKESLKAAAKESPSSGKLRKNATSSRPTSSPSSRHKTVLELDATKVAMVQVALEPSFPVDSLNEFPAMCDDAELTPWRSSPSEYFDSMNSCVPPPPEQLWQRHSDLTQHSLLRPPDSLDVAWTHPQVQAQQPPPADATKNAPTGLWRVSEHIETILRQISRQTKCDFNN